MSIKVQSFATIRLSVADVQQSRDWYKSLFGIEPVEDLENFVSFKISETLFDISLADEKSPVSTGGSVGYWLVDDIEDIIAHATRFGGRVYRGPLRVDEVRRTIVQIMDPFGGVVGFEATY